MDRIMNVTGFCPNDYRRIPMKETENRGMAQALVQVENQEERGVAYRL